MRRWIPIDEWFAIAEAGSLFIDSRPQVDDYVPEWQRRAENPELWGMEREGTEK